MRSQARPAGRLSQQGVSVIFDPPEAIDRILVRFDSLAEDERRELVRLSAMHGRLDVLERAAQAGWLDDDGPFERDYGRGENVLSKHALPMVDALCATLLAADQVEVNFGGDAQGWHYQVPHRPDLMVWVRDQFVQCLEELPRLHASRFNEGEDAMRRCRRHTAAVIASWACAMDDTDLLEQATRAAEHVLRTDLGGLMVVHFTSVNEVFAPAWAACFNSLQVLQALPAQTLFRDMGFEYQESIDPRTGKSSVAGRGLLHFLQEPMSPDMICCLMQRIGECNRDMPQGASEKMEAKDLKITLVKDLAGRDKAYAAAEVVRRMPGIFDGEAVDCLLRAVQERNETVAAHILHRWPWGAVQLSDDGLLNRAHPVSKIIAELGTSRQVCDEALVRVLQEVQDRGELDLLRQAQVRPRMHGPTLPLLHWLALSSKVQSIVFMAERGLDMHVLDDKGNDAIDCVTSASAEALEVLELLRALAARQSARQAVADALKGVLGP